MREGGEESGGKSGWRNVGPVVDREERASAGSLEMHRGSWGNTWGWGAGQRVGVQAGEGHSGVSERRREEAGAGLAGSTCSQTSRRLELGLWRQSAGIWTPALKLHWVTHWDVTLGKAHWASVSSFMSYPRDQGEQGMR